MIAELDGNHEGAGKRQPVSTGHGNRWLREILQEVAWAAARTKRSYYSAFYHRIRARQGVTKAIVAGQHSLLVAIWHMLSKSAVHADLGAGYFEQLNKDQDETKTGGCILAHRSFLGRTIPRTLLSN